MSRLMVVVGSPHPHMQHPAFGVRGMQQCCLRPFTVQETTYLHLDQ